MGEYPPPFKVFPAKITPYVAGGADELDQSLLEPVTNPQPLHRNQQLLIRNLLLVGLFKNQEDAFRTVCHNLNHLVDVEISISNEDEGGKIKYVNFFMREVANRLYPTSPDRASIMAALGRSWGHREFIEAISIDANIGIGHLVDIYATKIREVFKQRLEAERKKDRSVAKVISRDDLEFITMMGGALVVILFPDILGEISRGEEFGWAIIPKMDQLKLALEVGAAHAVERFGKEFVAWGLRFYLATAKFLEYYLKTLFSHGIFKVFQKEDVKQLVVDPAGGNTKFVNLLYKALDADPELREVYDKEELDAIYWRFFAIARRDSKPASDEAAPDREEVRINKGASFHPSKFRIEDLMKCPQYLELAQKSGVVPVAEVSRTVFGLQDIEEASDLAGLTPRGAVNFRQYLAGQGINKKRLREIEKLDRLTEAAQLEVVSVPPRISASQVATSDQDNKDWAVYYLKNQASLNLPYITPEIEAGLGLLLKELKAMADEKEMELRQEQNDQRMQTGEGGEEEEGEEELDVDIYETFRVDVPDPEGKPGETVSISYSDVNDCLERISELNSGGKEGENDDDGDGAEVDLQQEAYLKRAQERRKKRLDKEKEREQERKRRKKQRGEDEDEESEDDEEESSSSSDDDEGDLEAHDREAQALRRLRVISGSELQQLFDIREYQGPLLPAASTGVIYTPLVKLGNDLFQACQDFIKEAGSAGLTEGPVYAAIRSKLLDFKQTKWERLAEVVQLEGVKTAFPPLVPEMGVSSESPSSNTVKALGKKLGDKLWELHETSDRSPLYKVLVGLDDIRFSGSDEQIRFMADTIKNNPSILMLPIEGAEDAPPGAKSAIKILGKAGRFPLPKVEEQITLLDVIALVANITLLNDDELDLVDVINNENVSRYNLEEAQVIAGLPTRLMFMGIAEVGDIEDEDGHYGLTEYEQGAIMVLFARRCTKLSNILMSDEVAKTLVRRTPPLKRHFRKVAKVAASSAYWTASEMGRLGSIELLLKLFGDSSSITEIRSWANPIYANTGNLLVREFDVATWVTLACTNHAYTSLAQTVLDLYLAKCEWPRVLDEVREAIRKRRAQELASKQSPVFTRSALELDFDTVFPEGSFGDSEFLRDAFHSTEDLYVTIKEAAGVAIPSNLQVLMWLSENRLKTVFLKNPRDYLESLTHIYSHDQVEIREAWDLVTKPRHPEYGTILNLNDLSQVSAGLLSWDHLINSGELNDEWADRLYVGFRNWLAAHDDYKAHTVELVREIKNAVIDISNNQESGLVEHLLEVNRELYLDNQDSAWERGIARRQSVSKLSVLVETCHQINTKWLPAPKEGDFLSKYTRGVRTRLVELKEGLAAQLASWAEKADGSEDGSVEEIRYPPALTSGVRILARNLAEGLVKLGSDLEGAISHLTHSRSVLTASWWMVAVAYNTLQLLDQLEGFKLEQWYLLKHRLMNHLASADIIFGRKAGTIEQTIGPERFWGLVDPVLEAETKVPGQEPGKPNPEPTFFQFVQGSYFFYLPDLSGFAPDKLISKFSFNMLMPGDMPLRSEALIPRRLLTDRRRAQMVAWIHAHRPRQIVEDLLGKMADDPNTRREHCLAYLSCLFDPACVGFLQWSLISTVINFPAIDALLLRDWITLFIYTDYPFTLDTARLFMNALRKGTSSTTDSDLISHVKRIAIFARERNQGGGMDGVTSRKNYMIAKRAGDIAKLLKESVGKDDRGAASRLHKDLYGNFNVDLADGDSDNE